MKQPRNRHFWNRNGRTVTIYVFLGALMIFVSVFNQDFFTLGKFKNLLRSSFPLLMAALESCRGVLNALEVCESSDRLIGIALSGGDYTKDLQTVITGTGVELMGARQQMIIAARAAGVQCWDTVFTNLDAMDVFEEEVKMIKMMGFDGKSLVNPRQIDVVHKIFTPSQKEIIFAEKVVREIDEKKAQGIGVFTVDGKMIDIAFYDGARRTIALAKASGVYEGDL